MKELGLKEATTKHRGGESVALEALEKIISNADYTATFSKPATAPTAFSPQSTTLLSPHHHFGSLSVRLFYWRVMDVLATYPKGKQSTKPTNLIGQLLFRDMYFGAQAQLGYSFAQTIGNSHCSTYFSELYSLLRFPFKGTEISFEGSPDIVSINGYHWLKDTQDLYLGTCLPRSLHPTT